MSIIYIVKENTEAKSIIFSRLGIIFFEMILHYTPIHFWDIFIDDYDNFSPFHPVYCLLKYLVV